MSEDGTKIQDKQKMLLVLSIILFFASLAICVVVCLWVRRHENLRKSKLFDFSLTSESKYGNDSFVDKTM